MRRKDITIHAALQCHQFLLGRGKDSKEAAEDVRRALKKVGSKINKSTSIGDAKILILGHLGHIVEEAS